MGARILCLLLLVLAACSSDQLNRLDFRDLDADRFAFAFLDSSGRVVSVTRTATLDEAPSLMFELPDEAASTAVISWKDEDFAQANRCLTPTTIPSLEVAEPPTLVYPTEGPRVQSMKLAIPDSFDVRQAQFEENILIHADLPALDVTAVSTQVRLQAEMDTESPPLPYGSFVEVTDLGIGGVGHIRRIDADRVLVLSGQTVAIYEPASARILSEVSIGRGQPNLSYEQLDFFETEDELRIVVAGSAIEAPDAPRPISYTAFVRLRDDELEFVSDSTNYLGGLKTAVMTSSSSFVAAGYARTSTEGLNLLAGRWDSTELSVMAPLANTLLGRDVAERMTRAIDGIYLSTKQRVHYGPPSNLREYAIPEEFGRRARIFNMVQSGNVAYGGGDEGTIVRREGRGAIQVVPTEGFVLPPSTNGCVAVDEGRLAVASNDLSFIDWDGQQLSLLFKQCPLALVVDPITECVRVIPTAEPVVLTQENDQFRFLHVDDYGAFLVTQSGRLWFAPRLDAPSS